MNNENWNERILTRGFFLKILKIQTFQQAPIIRSRTILISHKYFLKLSKVCPAKKKIRRGNHAPFINREFKKEQSRLRNKFWKEPYKEHKLLFKTQRNKWVSMRRKYIKSYFQDIPKKVLSQISHSGISLNLFWPTKAAIHKMK